MPGFLCYTTPKLVMAKEKLPQTTFHFSFDEDRLNINTSIPMGSSQINEDIIIGESKYKIKYPVKIKGEPFPTIGVFTKIHPITHVLIFIVKEGHFEKDPINTHLFKWIDDHNEIGRNKGRNKMTEFLKEKNVTSYFVTEFEKENNLP